MPFLERALAWFAGHGVSVERVMTDNGSAYRTKRCGKPAPHPGSPHPNQALSRRAPTARPSGSSRPACESGPTPGLRLLAAAPRSPRRVARALQYRAAAHRAGQPAARRPPRPNPVSWFDQSGRSCVPTWLARRPQRRAGARIAKGDRQPPARSVLAADRRCGHAHPRRDTCLIP